MTTRRTDHRRSLEGAAEAQRFWTRELHIRIRHAIDDGVNIHAVARATGLSRRTIRRHRDR